MKQEELKVITRDTLGKKVRFLRRKGLTPANLYGPNIESIPLQVETTLLKRLIARVGRNALVTLMVDGKPRVVMIRDIQRNPLTDDLLHVGFFQVEMTHRVKTEVPLLFLGDAPAAKSSRVMLLQDLTALQVEALPGELPRNIEVDLSGLEEIGHFGLSLTVVAIVSDDGEASGGLCCRINRDIDMLRESGSFPCEHRHYRNH